MPAWLVDLFARYGYAVVFGGVFLENAGLPVPGRDGAARRRGAGALRPPVALAGRRRRRSLAARSSATTSGFFIGRHGGRAARRAARMAGRPDARRGCVQFDAFFRPPRREDRVHRAVRHRPAGVRRGAGRRQRPARGRRSCSTTRPARSSGRRAVGAAGYLLGAQLGDARALDRPHAASSAWSSSSSSRRCGRERTVGIARIMITLASGLSYLDLHFLGVPRVIATAVLHGRRRRRARSIPGRRARCRRCGPSSQRAGIGDRAT